MKKLTHTKSSKLKIVLFSCIMSFASIWSSAQYTIELVAELGHDYSGEFSFIDENIGYHFSSSVITKTIDGGETWNEFIPNIQDITNPDGLYMQGQFISEEIGWVVLRKYDDDDNIRDSSFLYKTIDAGLNWELSTINPPNEIIWAAATFSDVFFKNEMEGWVFGNGLLKHTTDGGESWTTLFHNIDNSSNNDVMTEMCFSNDSTAYIAGYGAWIQQSTDYGATWETQHFNGESVHDDYFMTDIAFTNSEEGYATTSHGLLKKTMNGGTDWEDISTEHPDDNNAIFIDEYNTIWSAAGGYCDDTGCYWTSILLYSTDGGETWITLYDVGSSYEFTDVVWPSSDYGFACTANGKIYKIRREDVGVNQLEVERLALYPNPAYDFINIDVSGEFAHVNIINSLGQILINSNASTINVQDLVSGTYWVCTYDDSENLISSEKFTKH